MDKQLRRILDLIRRTGDRMVVTDANGEDVYVVMGLEQYESLVDVSLPDDEGGWDEGWWDDNAGLDKPNGGPGTQGGFAEPETVAPPAPSTQPAPSDIWEAMQPAGEPGDTWDLSKMSDVEKSDLERQFQEYQRQKEQESSAKAPVSQKPEESKETPAKEEDFGEEQFYLEPVE